MKDQVYFVLEFHGPDSRNKRRKYGDVKFKASKLRPTYNTILDQLRIAANAAADDEERLGLELLQTTLGGYVRYVSRPGTSLSTLADIHISRDLVRDNNAAAATAAGVASSADLAEILVVAHGAQVANLLLKVADLALQVPDLLLPGLARCDDLVLQRLDSRCRAADPAAGTFPVGYCSK